MVSTSVPTKASVTGGVFHGGNFEAASKEKQTASVTGGVFHGGHFDDIRSLPASTGTPNLQKRAEALRLAVLYLFAGKERQADRSLLFDSVLSDGPPLWAISR